jgi:glycosyltransferase involved in cell wall biosynthesis
VVFSDDAPVVFHQVPAFAVQPVKGKINVLYTACETEDLPEIFIEGAKKTDLIICTSDFVKDTFQRAVPGKPVVTVPLGVDINVWDYRKRHYNQDKPFIYLWVGAPDFRKGWDLVLRAWDNDIDTRPFCLREDVGLVMKTTGKNIQTKCGNVVFEGRKLSVEELVKIFHIAHCFIFPSYAEGFGLPLAEAMSTGLPCLFTPWGGVTQFASKKNAFPLKYKLVDIDYGVKTRGAMASHEDLVRTMKYVKSNYRQALIRGKNARRTIENDFTWDDTAHKIKNIIEGFVRNGTINNH